MFSFCRVTAKTFFTFPDVQQSNMLSMMASLQRRLDQQSATDQELHFFSHSLQSLSTYSGQHVKLESWMVTPYEVEFGQRIGEGGLFVFLLSILLLWIPICETKQWSGVSRILETDRCCTQGAQE
jgi:hypothetical protein